MKRQSQEYYQKLLNEELAKILKIKSDKTAKNRKQQKLWQWQNKLVQSF